MAGKPEIDAAIAALLASIQDQITSVTAELASVSAAITEATNAISRLLGKIAAGSPDLQPEVDQLTSMKATIDAAKSNVDAGNAALTSAIATFKVEGN